MPLVELKAERNFFMKGLLFLLQGRAPGAPATMERKAPATTTAQGGVSSGGRKSALGAAWRNLTLPPFTYKALHMG